MNALVKIFSQLNIRKKLLLSITTFALAIVIITAIVMYNFTYNTFHNSHQTQITMLSDILAESSEAAVAFNDSVAANQLMSGLVANATVSGAAIIKNNNVFAFFPDKLPQDKQQFLLSVSSQKGVRQLQNHYYAVSPIQLQNNEVGRVIIEFHQDAWQKMQLVIMEVIGLLVGAIVLLTIVMSVMLQKHISQPLLNLSAWAQEKAKSKNFSGHAQKQNNDEIGTLVDSLNVMLNELSKQESILRWNERLEKEIRERKLVEEQLIATRDKAEAANQAKSQFLANMSHELRTPLNAIIGYSEMLQEITSDGELDAEEFSNDLGKIKNSGQHLLTLINDILDISKIEAGRMQLNIEDFYAEELVADVISTAEPLARKNGNKLEIKMESDLGMLSTDMVKLRQILYNLLSNACKFTQNGNVKLHCRRIKNEVGDFIQFEVVDDGIGISREKQSQLFTPFTQEDASTSRKFGGTGLGLAISQSFINMLKGEIKLFSEQGKGTQFSVQLPTICDDPCGEKQQKESGECSESLEKHFGDGCRLLIIDDDKQVHDVLGYQLSNLGFEVIPALKGHDGLTIAKEENPDIIVLDIMMPEIDGWQVLQKLKTDPATSHIPVILYSIVSDIHRGMALGASDYLVKPVSSEKLRITLSKFTSKNTNNTLLAVDDDLDALALLEHSLIDSHWSIIKTTSAMEGLKILKKQQDIDLILSDLLMPEMNGFEFIEKVREQPDYAHIPIVVLSAKELSQKERFELENHCQCLMSKADIQKKQLISQLTEIVNQNGFKAKSPREVHSATTG